MNVEAGMFLLPLLLLACCMKPTTMFLSSCPSPKLWQSVAENKCSSGRLYHCLLVFEKSEYMETCQEPMKKAAGSRVQLNSNAETGSDPTIISSRCPNNLYQPFPYYSNQLRDCIYLKSECNEIGQTLFQDGTVIADKTCRCDHQKGYAFVFRTQNRCFCNPSQEDCSCYIKPCLNSSYILSSGYDCVLSKKDGNICSFRTNGAEPSAGHEKASRRMEVAAYTYTKYNIEQTKGDNKSLVVLVLRISIVVVVFFIGFYFIYTCAREANRQPKSYEIVEFKTRKEMVNLNVDTTFVFTKGYETAVTTLDKFNVVIIKGRYGTGKTSLAFRLALNYVGENGYAPYKFDKKDLLVLQLLMKEKGKQKNIVIILENIIGDCFDDNTDFKEWKAMLSFLLSFRVFIKLIVTTYVINQELQDFTIQYPYQSNTFKKDSPDMTFETITVDLDNPNILSYENKNEILKSKCEKYGRAFTEDLTEIQNCESVIGYPLMCTYFCSDQNNFSLGRLFFHTTPESFVEKIQRLKHQGFDNNLAAVSYTTLVHKDTFLSVNMDSRDDFKMFRKIFENTFKKTFSLAQSCILGSLYAFMFHFLKNKNKDEFGYNNVGVKRAVLITYAKVAPIHVIEVVPLIDLLHIFRPGKYERRQFEAVVQLSKTAEYKKLFNRIGKDYSTYDNSKHIGMFLHKYAFCYQDWDFIAGVLQSVEKSRKHLKDHKFVSSLLQIFYGMTNSCTCVLPFALEPRNFRLTWEIITASKWNIQGTLRKLLENLRKENNGKDIILTPIDEFQNTLLHYFVVWGYDICSGFCNETYFQKDTNSIINACNLTPIHFAAYLGRQKHIKTLLLSNHNDSRKTNETWFRKLEQTIAEGKALAGRNEQNTHKEIKWNTDIVQTITFGNEEHYDEISKVFYKKYSDVQEKIRTKDIAKAQKSV